MHGQCGHAHVHFVASGTLLGQLRVGTAVRLLVTGQIGRGGVVLATLGARIPRPVLAVHAGHAVHEGTAAVAVAPTARLLGALAGAAVADEERIVRVADRYVLLVAILASASSQAAIVRADRIGVGRVLGRKIARRVVGRLRVVRLLTPIVVVVVLLGLGLEDELFVATVPLVGQVEQLLVGDDHHVGRVALEQRRVQYGRLALVVGGQARVCDKPRLVRYVQQAIDQ